MSRAHDLNTARRIGRELAPCPYRQRHLRAAWSRAYEARTRNTFADVVASLLRAPFLQTCGGAWLDTLGASYVDGMQRGIEDDDAFRARVRERFAETFAGVSQSNFEEWESAERDRLGHYPGHEDACPMRAVESLLTASCGCGPKDDVVIRDESMGEPADVIGYDEGEGQ